MKILNNPQINKKIFIFYDDHSNIKYCNEKKPQTFVSDLFESFLKINNDIVLILEEPFMEPDSKIKILWEDSEHLLLFRKFYGKLINKCSNEKICKIFPFDIRLSLFDISPDEIIFNLDNPKQEYNIDCNKYFENIFYLFDLIEIKPESKSIIFFIKKVFSIYKESKFYKFLKKRIINFKNKYKIDTIPNTIYNLIKEHNITSNFIYEEGFPYNNNHNDNFIDQLDKIASGIMEMYSIILILLLPNKNIILYSGYYHSNNLAYVLEKYYNFKKEYSKGNTNNIQDENNITNCLEINKKYITFIE